MFLSKCCEKVVASQFISHLRENKLEEIFQSAYKVGHSAESALLRVHNDMLRALDDRKCVMLVLLDLSEAFDTVDHGIPLSRLSQCIGVQGSAYTWFESYLSDRIDSLLSRTLQPQAELRLIYNKIYTTKNTWLRRTN